MTREKFQNRQQILEAGFYQAILEAVSDLLASSETSTTVLDIGCGEGILFSQTQESHPDKPSMPLTSPKIPSKSLLRANPIGSQLVCWRLSSPPYKDASMDILFDIFSLPTMENFVAFYPKTVS